MKDWKKELDVQLSLLVEEGTLTVDYKNAVLVQGFLEKFVETLLQEERERVARGILRRAIECREQGMETTTSLQRWIIGEYLQKEMDRLIKENEEYKDPGYRQEYPTKKKV